MHSAPKRAQRRGQSLVEFTLVAPLLFLIIAVTIDFARLVYVYGAVASITREGARTLSLKDQDTSDCLVYRNMEAAASGGFSLLADPKSQAGDSDPNNPSGALQPSVPPPGQGYIYIYPALSTGSPPDSPSFCAGSGASRSQLAQVRDVTVLVQYGFRPWISLVASFIPNFTIKTISIVQREY